MAAVEGPSRPDGFADQGSEGGRHPPASPIASADLERIIGRAAELQAAAGEQRAEYLDADEIVRIGREVGLDARHVRQALAELRADALLPEPPRGRAAAIRLWGASAVRSSRVVPGDAAAVQSRVEAHLRDRESLREMRRRPGRSVWEPSSSFLSKMERGLDLSGRGYLLADARRLELAVAPLEPGWCLVTLIADLGNLRARHVAGWFGGSLPFFGIAALGLVLSAGLPPVGAGLLALAASGGAAAVGPGFTYGRRRQRIALALAGLLDRLEQGGSLDAGGPGWREKLFPGS